MIRFQVDEARFRKEVAQAVDEGMVSQRQAMENVMHMVGEETIAYLRSYTSQRVPPVRAGEAWRRAHPGGWSDVTSNLVNAYGFTVEAQPGQVRLTFYNTMEYAAMVEARDGFFVLQGITDPGGPVDKALREALRAIVPGAELDYG
jgi:hypothetical protein